MVSRFISSWFFHGSPGHLAAACKASRAAISDLTGLRSENDKSTAPQPGDGVSVRGKEGDIRKTYRIWTIHTFIYIYI